MTKTSITTLRDADWQRMETEVVEKIHTLRDLAAALEPNPINDKIAQDLIMPALTSLGQFCAAVTVEKTK